MLMPPQICEKKGEALYRVHCDFESDFDFVQEAADRNTGFRAE